MFANLWSAEDLLTTKEIWNRALGILGMPKIASTSEASPQADIINCMWEEFRKGFLADHTWNGATTAEALVRYANIGDLVEVAPVSRWTFAYILPLDYLRIYAVNGLENEKAWNTIYSIETLANDIGRSRVLVSDQSTIITEHIFDVGTQVGLLGAKTRKAMAYNLANEISGNFGKSLAEQESLKEDARRILADARSVDGQEGSPKFFSATSLLQARQGTRGRHLNPG